MGGGGRAGAGDGLEPQLLGQRRGNGDDGAVALSGDGGEAGREIGPCLAVEGLAHAVAGSALGVEKHAEAVSEHERGGAFRAVAGDERLLAGLVGAEETGGGGDAEGAGAAVFDRLRGGVEELVFTVRIHDGRIGGVEVGVEERAGGAEALEVAGERVIEARTVAGLALGADDAGPDDGVVAAVGHAVELGGAGAFRARDLRHERKLALFGPVHQVAGSGVAHAEIVFSAGPDEMKQPGGVAKQMRVAQQAAADRRFQEHPVEVGPVEAVLAEGEVEAVAFAAKRGEEIGGRGRGGGGPRQGMGSAGGEEEGGDVGGQAG